MDAYLTELRALLAERQKLDKRISRVEKVLRGMIDLLDTDEEQMEYIEKLDDIRPPAGLTEAILQVLQSQSDKNKALFPTEIRDLVKSYLLNHSNEMASVHTTLKRIAKNNPAVEIVEKDGKAAYRWTPSTNWDHLMSVAALGLEVDASKPGGHPVDKLKRRLTIGDRIAGRK